MEPTSGTAYEILVRNIFFALLNQDAVKNVDVRHNVVLKGRTTNHQIDVYWEFELAKVRYRTIVQAKDWNSPVHQGELLKFKAVLDDLPDQPRGIVVTRSSYQTGARCFAEAHGILLYELVEDVAPSRPPIQVIEGSFGKYRVYARRKELDPSYQYSDELSWARDLVMEITVYDPAFSDVRFEYDFAWAREKRDEVGIEALNEVAPFQIVARPRDVDLYGDDSSKIGTLQDVFTSFVREMEKTGSLDQVMRKTFDVPTSLKTASLKVPFLKVSAVSARITLTPRAPIEGHTVAANIVRFILKNLDSTTQQVFELDTSSNQVTIRAEIDAAADDAARHG